MVLRLACVAATAWQTWATSTNGRPAHLHPQAAHPPHALHIFPCTLQVKNWTKAVRLARTGQASQSILDCDRIIVPVRRWFDGGLRCMAVQA